MERFFWKVFKRFRRLIVRKYFTYFAGPMDLAKDKGVKWREKYAPLLVKHVPAIIQDPTQEQCRKFGVNTVQESHEVLFRIREEGGDKRFFETILENFFRPDLKMVRYSDFIIVYWDFHIITVGTIHEMVEAVTYQIPIYFLTDEEDIKELSTWLQTLIWLSGGRIFVNSNTGALFKEAFEYLGEKYGSKKNIRLIKTSSEKSLPAVNDLSKKDSPVENKAS